MHFNSDVTLSEKWTHKIGVIYIASSSVLEREWALVLPPDVSFHVARVTITGSVTREAIWNMVISQQVEQAVQLLREAEVDMVAFACTIGSLIGGLEWDKEFIERISRVSGTPATTTATEVVNALRFLKCRRIAVITPYVEELNTLEKAFLESHGFEVLSISGFGVEKDQEIARIPPATIYRVARDLFFNLTRVDCVFLSCTNMRSLEVISKLEEELNIPVISSNSATLWGCLRKLRYGRPIRGYGVLLEHFL